MTKRSGPYLACAAFGKWSGGVFAGWEAVLQLLNFSTSFAITMVLFAMIYKLMPRARIDHISVGSPRFIGYVASAVGCTPLITRRAEP